MPLLAPGIVTKRKAFVRHIAKKIKLSPAQVNICINAWVDEILEQLGRNETCGVRRLGIFYIKMRTRTYNIPGRCTGTWLYPVVRFRSSRYTKRKIWETIPTKRIAELPKPQESVGSQTGSPQSQTPASTSQPNQQGTNSGEEIVNLEPLRVTESLKTR